MNPLRRHQKLARDQNIDILHIATPTPYTAVWKLLKWNSPVHDIYHELRSRKTRVSFSDLELSLKHQKEYSEELNVININIYIKIIHLNEYEFRYVVMLTASPRLWIKYCGMKKPVMQSPKWFMYRWNKVLLVTS